MKLDLASYKKIMEDQHTVTMQNDHGHEMKFILKKLSPIQREQMKRLKLCSGGGVKHYASGTPTAPISDQPDNQMSSPESESPSFTDSLKTASVGAPPATNQPVPPEQMASIGQNQSPMSQAQQNSTPEPPKPFDVNEEVGKATDHQLARDQRILGDLASNNKMIAQQIDQTDKWLHGDPTSDDPEAKKGHEINENAYIQNMSTPATVANAIGLFLGGISTINGGSNPALDFLNKQIDRNIAGQQSRWEQHKTILGAYQQLYNNKNVAIQMARATGLDMFNHEMQQAAFKIGTPEALQRAAVYDQWTKAQKAQAIGAAAQAKTQDDKANPLGGVPSEILKPGSAQRLAAYTQIPNSPAAGYMHELLGEQEGIRQSEKGLATIDSAFPRLAKNTSFGQYVASKFSPSELKDAATDAAEYGAGAYGAGKALKSGAGGGGAAEVATGAPEGLLAEGAAGAGTAAGEAGAAMINPLIAIGVAGLGAGAAAYGWSDRDIREKHDADRALIFGAVNSATKGNATSEDINKAVNDGTPQWKDTPEVLEYKARLLKDFIHSHTNTYYSELAGMADKYTPIKEKVGVRKP